MAKRDEPYITYVAAARPRLYRAAYLLCGDTHRAEDIVQIALAKLYVSWRRVSRADSIDAYVRRVLVNAHRDETRRPWRREQPVQDRDLDGLDGVAAARDLEAEDELLAALRELPAGQRRVVVLRHYWGLSVEETAADLGVSGGTVKSQTAAALARLRSLLEPTQAGGA